MVLGLYAFENQMNSLLLSITTQYFQSEHILSLGDESKFSKDIEELLLEASIHYKDTIDSLEDISSAGF